MIGGWWGDVDCGCCVIIELCVLWGLMSYEFWVRFLYVMF